MRDEPPCETCFIELRPENRTIIRVFEKSISQVTYNGDPDIMAIKTVMDIYGIMGQRFVLDNVLFCFSVLKSIQKKDNNG